MAGVFCVWPTLDWKESEERGGTDGNQCVSINFQLLLPLLIEVKLLALSYKQRQAGGAALTYFLH